MSYLQEVIYEVSIAFSRDKGNILRLVKVQDKLLPNDAINEIPLEFIIPANVPLTETNDFEGTQNERILEENSALSKICTICSSADYRAFLNQPFVCCSSCSAGFHLSCLGLSSACQDQFWNCPICDNVQEMSDLATHGNFRRRVQRRAYRPRPLMINPSRTLQRNLHIFGSDSDSSRRTKANVSENYLKSPRGLVIYNEHNELNDDFLHADNYEVDENGQQNAMNSFQLLPIINGGVLLRKEQREKEKLTKEEAKSWELFDKARGKLEPQISNELSDCGSSFEAEPSSSRDRKKRKKPSSLIVENTVAMTSLPKSTEGVPSRISQLIGGLKKDNRSKNTLCLAKPSFEEAMRNTSASLVTTGGSMKAIEGSSSSLMSDNSLGLTKEHKSRIQKLLRQSLRFYYKPGHPVNQGDICINSEKQYFNINKQTSRKIYGHITSLVKDQNGKINSISLDSFFTDETKLKDIVDTYLKNEIKIYVRQL